MKPLVIAHRGFSGIAPENTMAAFKLAAGLGVDYIELDVHQTSDGYLVCHHDEDLSRTTGVKKKIRDITYEELSKLDAGSKFSSKFKGEPVPLFKDALALGVPLLVEIKKGSGYYPRIEENILRLLEESPIGRKCIIQSFESDVLEHFASLSDNYEIHKLVTGNIPILPLHIDSKLKTGKLTKYRDVDGINPNFRFLNARLVKKIHKAGKKAFTWTPNRKSHMEKLISFGVDGIITDFPDLLIKVIKENEALK